MKMTTSKCGPTNTLSQLFGRTAVAVSASLIVSNTAFAIVTKTKPDSIGAAPAGSLVQVTLGLFVVLAAIVIGAWLVRRLGHFPATPASDLKILGGLSMGPRERVVLIQVGKEQVLIGVAPGRVQKIHVLDEPVEKTTVDKAGSTGFAGRFKDALAQQFGGKPTGSKSQRTLGERVE